MHTNPSRLLSLMTFLALTSGEAKAQSIENAGDLPGGTVEAAGTAVSGDGNFIVGRSVSASGYEAFRWSLGTGIVGLGDLPGGFFESTAQDANADGSVVVGSGSTATLLFEAFRWVDGVGMVGLGSLPGSTDITEAFGVNAAGDVVVGRGINAAADYEAFRWVDGVGMAGLGDLAGGGFYSTANAVNAAGNIVVGASTSASGFEAYRWVDGVGMTGLGDLAGGGFDSIAFDVNAAGDVVVGQSTSASGFEAFRWVDGVGMTGLGDLAGGTFESKANAVNASGTVVVGYGDGGGGQDAFYWEDGVGMQSLADLLTTAGVDLTGWTLVEATGVDDSGDVVTGYAGFGGDTTAFIATLAAGGGITTPADLSDALLAATVPAQQTQSALTTTLGQSLFAAANSISSIEAQLIDVSSPASIAPASGDNFSRNWSAYAVGSFGIGQDNDTDNHALNGTTGIAVQLSDHLSVGAGVIGSTGRTELEYDGKSSLHAVGASVLSAYTHPSGLRLYSTAFLANLNIETNRRYLNGAGTDGSRGEIDGIGYGGAIRAGWEMMADNSRAFMPYVELDATKIHLDDYTETEGAFPAAFGSQTSHQVTSRMGLQVNQQFNPDLTLGTRVAWARRLSEGSGLSASSTGFTGVLGAEKGDSDWLEGTLTAGWKLDASSSFNAELTGRTHKTQDPSAALTVGLRIGF